MKRFMGIVVFSALSSGILMAGDPKAGQVAFEKSCKTCHLTTGAPIAKVATMLKVEMKDLSSKEVQGLSDAQMKKVITEGEGKMKAAKTVTAKDVDDITAFVRSLKK